MRNQNITRICPTCLRTFHVSPSNSQRFCRLACWRAHLADPERFWEQVDRTGDCWIWRGRIDREGYGRARRGLAHRLSWTLVNGPIPAGMAALHSCDVKYPPGDITYRACVRPAHLFLGSQAENIVDRDRKHRQWRKLSDEDIVAIRAALATGTVLQLELQRQYGISSAHISRIATYKRRVAV